MRNLRWMALLALIMLGQSGCNVIEGAAAVLSPPELIEAKYALPDKPTLVLVDDWRGLVNNEATTRRIAGAARAALEAEGVVTDGFVGQAELAVLKQELGDDYGDTSLAALAMQLDARQVIHAEVVSYQMDIGGELIRPSITLHVKVFDLDERKRVFPTDDDPVARIADGARVYPLEQKLPGRDLTGQSIASSIAARELADIVGRDLGRLFFDWRVPDVGDDLDR